VTVEALRRLAERLDVDEVAFVPLAAHGRLRLSGARVILEVSSELSEFEKRFTLAHELAHRVIEASRMDEARLTGLANRVVTAEEEGSLEMLCDLLAGDVLLPEDWLLRRLNHTTPTEAALVVAEELGYPVEFVLSRIFELRIWGGLVRHLDS
jgi:Zn-dependent peptidase ImmA (M78 family)